MTLDYYYGDQAEQFSFYRIPKVLFTDSRFKDISAEAKILYGLLLDRMSLSAKNGWLDQEGRVYIVYTVEDIMDALSCASQKAMKLLNELDEKCGLIERKRNVPHLKTFATSGNGDFNKASLIGVDYDTEYAQEFLRDHKNMRMIINARAVCESRPLARLMDDALDEVCDKYDLDCQVFFTECFGMADEGR